MTDIQPRKGLRFLHARQITPDSTAANPVPETCTVTAVRNGEVYYRNSTGFKSRISAEEFTTIVSGLLPEVTK